MQRIKVRKIDMPQLNIRIPADLKERLEEMAVQKGRSVNAEIIKLVEEALNKKSNSPFQISMSISEQLADLAEKVSELEQK